MFTGLVQDVGTVTSATPQGAESKLTISSSFEELDLGESIAVNGVCLSVTHIQQGAFSVFASSETMRTTSLARAVPGRRVNLERALRPVDRMGGHIVSGHVDAVVELISRDRTGEAERWRLTMPKAADLKKQVAPKGSVTLDGVSLTVNRVEGSFFEVMIIPVTMSHTTLKDAAPGAEINLETDVLAKYVTRALAKGDGADGGVTLDLLTRSGFMR